MNDGSFLAAIRANPADDLPRLVYADWLEEQGNPDRAAFIRLQIEAERLHPDSNRRAALEAQAEALFAEHWIDWWGEVCVAVGLPLPERPRATRFGRLARRLWVGESIGLPYRRDRFDVAAHNDGLRPAVVALYQTGFGSVGFRRGFPDSLTVTAYWGYNGPTDWPAALLPLRELRLAGPVTSEWDRFAEARFAGVSRVVLSDWGDGWQVPASVLAWPGPRTLTELRFEADHAYPTTQPDVDAVAVSPVGSQLRRLELPLPDGASADALARADRLSGLTALAIELEFEPDLDDVAAMNLPPDPDRARLEALARSPHLAGLTELHVSGVLSAAGVRALVHRPAWAGLRTLTLTHYWDLEYVDGLADGTLPDLIDLRLDAGLGPEALRRLARLPLLRQLRHLRLTPLSLYETPDADVLAVADALDPDRLETLSLRSAHLSAGVRAELTHRFGDRVRFP